MLEVIQGVPGSGKTLYAVKKLLEATNNHYYTITNIDGFASADEYVDSTLGKDLVDFILGRDWEEFSKKINKKIYLVIDEAQRVYPAMGMERATQQDLLYFLEYHRHYGMDISLVTQSKKSLNTRVFPLFHQICQVSKIMFGNKQRVRIHDPSTWEIIQTDTFKREQKYFDAYISASTDAGLQKPVNPLKRIFTLLILGGGSLALAAFLMFYIISGFIQADETEPTPTDPKPTRSVKPSIRQVKKPITPADLYDWHHPQYPHQINSQSCYKSSSDFAWECEGLPNTKRLKLSANFSMCTTRTCTMYFEDVEHIRSEYEKYETNVNADWTTQTGFKLPSSISDFSDTAIQQYQSAYK